MPLPLYPSAHTQRAPMLRFAAWFLDMLYWREVIAARWRLAGVSLRVRFSCPALYCERMSM